MEDPGIFLFGKKIHLPETVIVTTFPAVAGEDEERANREDTVAEKGYSSIYRNPHHQPEDEWDENPKTSSINEETTPEKAPVTGTEGEPKALKKPDKILPCPRCESTDTKFCYYNNCNVNQPRHFCKSCQRYWTAGGTMRSMPVGAGRRKKKNPASHFITISQDLAADSTGAHKVLSFGSNPPNFGAVVSGQARETGTGDDCSGGSCITTSTSTEKVQDNNGFCSQVPWIPYNPWNPTIPIPIPIPFPIPGYPPVPIYPSPYWSSVPWLPPSAHLPVLGKHSREGNETKNSVLIPKTLRIDDPDEAAKSSIWATLGIKNENCSRGDLCKAFEEKGDGKKKYPTTSNSSVMQANPAALSRSLCFQERA